MVSRSSESVVLGQRSTRAKTLSIIAGAAVCLLAATTATEGQTVSDPAAPAPAATQGRAASTQQDPSPWRSIKFGATLEGYYSTTGIALRTAAWSCARTIRAPTRSASSKRRSSSTPHLMWRTAAVWIACRPAVWPGHRDIQGSPANEPRPNVYRNVWQAYGTYVFPVGTNGLQADFGKFASMLGYETNYAKDNQAFCALTCSTSCPSTTPACD